MNMKKADYLGSSRSGPLDPSSSACKIIVRPRTTRVNRTLVGVHLVVNSQLTCRRAREIRVLSRHVAQPGDSLSGM